MLNTTAHQLLTSQSDRLGLLGIDDMRVGGARVLDCGVASPGGIAAGVLLAEASMAGLGTVSVGGGHADVFDGPWVNVRTDRPVAACMASQYAGWRVEGEGFFAMASGPMRAAYGGETLFDQIGYREAPTLALGVLEADRLPTAEACHLIASKCRIDPAELTLLVTPTTSLAGCVQIAARSIETALHKLHELGFDLRRVVSGFGASPLPPPAPDFVAAIGRTNDAILYGGHATLYVRGDDPSLAEVGAKTPSNASADHGRPFAQIFKASGFDFYKIDPLLFSPAVVTLVNVETGRTHRFGAYAPAVLAESFGPGDDRAPR